MTVHLKDGREWKFKAEDGMWIYRTPKNLYRLFFDVGVEYEYPHIWIGLYAEQDGHRFWFRADSQFLCIPMLGGHYFWS